MRARGYLGTLKIGPKGGSSFYGATARGEVSAVRVDGLLLISSHVPRSVSSQVWPTKARCLIFETHAIKRARPVGSISGGIAGTSRPRDPSDGI